MNNTNNYFIDKNGALQECVEVIRPTLNCFRELESESLRVLSIKDILEQRIRANSVADKECISFWNQSFDTSSSVMYDLQNGVVKVNPNSSPLLKSRECKYQSNSNSGKAVLERRLFEESEGDLISIQDFLQNRPVLTPQSKRIFDIATTNDRTAFDLDYGDEYLFKKNEELFEGVNLMDFFEGVKNNLFWKNVLGYDMEIGRKYFRMITDNHSTNLIHYPDKLKHLFSTETWVEDLSPDYIQEEFLHLDWALNGKGKLINGCLIKFRNPIIHPLGQASMDISHEYCRLVGVNPKFLE